MPPDPEPRIRRRNRLDRVAQHSGGGGCLFAWFFPSLFLFGFGFYGGFGVHCFVSIQGLGTRIGGFKGSGRFEGLGVGCHLVKQDLGFRGVNGPATARRKNLRWS